MTVKPVDGLAESVHQIMGIYSKRSHLKIWIFSMRS